MAEAMSTQPEAKFKAELKKRFHEAPFSNKYWLPLVASTFQRAGIPDLFVSAHGKQAWMEIKVNGNDLSPIQVKEIRDMTNAGVRVVVLHADMRKEKDQRLVELYKEPRNSIPTVLFKWSDLNTLPFWETVLR